MASEKKVPPSIADSANALREIVRMQRQIAQQRKEEKKQNTMGYMFQVTLFTLLTSAFSFVGAFVIRDLFKTMLETSLKNMGLPDIVGNLVYVIVTLGLVIPILVFITWWKSDVKEKKTSVLRN